MAAASAVVGEDSMAGGAEEAVEDMEVVEAMLDMGEVAGVAGQAVVLDIIPVEDMALAAAVARVIIVGDMVI